MHVGTSLILSVRVCVRVCVRSMDLMLGGDLKFHLINAGRFPEVRAKFYAAQVLLGTHT